LASIVLQSLFVSDKAFETKLNNILNQILNEILDIPSISETFLQISRSNVKKCSFNLFPKGSSLAYMIRYITKIPKYKKLLPMA
jgi:hypothetical protein